MISDIQTDLRIMLELTKVPKSISLVNSLTSVMSSKYAEGC
jgi:hypothetical protein